MLIEILWPVEWQLKVNAIEVKNDKLLVEVQGTQKQANCPDCGRPSSRRNGRYCRRPADLPCAGYAVQLELTVPRFFCDNEDCARRTFAAEFPDVLKRYARRTNRLIDQQQCVGFTLSGESGSRLLRTLAMWTSPDPLLRLSVSRPGKVSDRVRNFNKYLENYLNPKSPYPFFERLQASRRSSYL